MLLVAKNYSIGYGKMSINIKSNNTITVHIRRLREKLNDTLENPKYIKTIWGVGYKIDEE